MKFLTDHARTRAEIERWDTVSSDVADLYGAASTQYYRRCEIALLERFAEPLAGKRVLKLDLWNEANNTRILHWIESRGAVAYGLDLSTVTAARARDNSRREGHDVSIVCADIREVPFEDESFDLVYTMGTIEHIDEYQRAVDEARRVLAIGGRAIVGVPYKWDPFLRPLVVKALEAVGRYPYAPEKAFSARELRSVIERAGLVFRHRSGILTLPGVIRMADLLLFKNGIPVGPVTAGLCWPFECLERRWNWWARLGYLMAIVADRVERDAPTQSGRYSVNGSAPQARP